MNFLGPTRCRWLQGDRKQIRRLIKFLQTLWDNGEGNFRAQWNAIHESGSLPRIEAIVWKRSVSLTLLFIRSTSITLWMFEFRYLVNAGKCKEWRWGISANVPEQKYGNVCFSLIKDNFTLFRTCLAGWVTFLQTLILLPKRSTIFCQYLNLYFLLYLYLKITIFYDVGCKETKKPRLETLLHYYN